MTPLTPGSELPDTALFDLLAEKHGHYCPMSTLGLRIGWAARARSGAAPRRLVYRARTCAVDGIALALDLPEVSVDEQGEHRLYLASDDGTILRIGLRETALAQAASYRHFVTDTEREQLLEYLRRAAEAELLEIDQLEVEA